MNKEQLIEFRLLQIRNAIVLKESIVQSMRRDMECFGNWQCDWPSGLQHCEEEIQQAQTKLLKGE